MTEPKPQPWHEADEKPAKPRGGGAPIGTHSLTGTGASVGMPPKAEDVGGDDAGSGLTPERSRDRDTPLGQPDPLAEPRAGTMKR